MQRFIAQLFEVFSPSLIKFILIGGLAVLMHFLIVIALFENWVISSALANAIAFVLATVFSNIANTYWSFQSAMSRRVFVRFWLVALLGLTVAVAISSAADWFGLHYLIGTALVVMITPIISYNLHKHWTYQ